MVYSSLILTYLYFLLIKQESQSQNCKVQGFARKINIKKE